MVVKPGGPEVEAGNKYDVGADMKQANEVEVGANEGDVLETLDCQDEKRRLNPQLGKRACSSLALAQLDSSTEDLGAGVEAGKV